MFELSVAFKYLIPRWRQLSVSIISLVSMLVIALVVWLIVVFFSVKEGLESSWIDKLIALTAPIRITPTEKYYHSYYYQIDSISEQSDYTYKTLREKLKAESSDPYNPYSDEEPPRNWQRPDLDAQGKLKDLVKITRQAVLSLPEIQEAAISDYEMTAGNLKLRLIRPLQTTSLKGGKQQLTEQFIEQSAYLGSFDSDTPAISKTLLPLTSEDIDNLILMQAISPDNILEDAPEGIHYLKKQEIQERLRQLFDVISITGLKTHPSGWIIPRDLLPTNGSFQGIAILGKKNEVSSILIPTTINEMDSLTAELKKDGVSSTPVSILFKDGLNEFILSEDPFSPTFSLTAPVALPGGVPLKAAIAEGSLGSAIEPANIRFYVTASIQGMQIGGEVPLGNLIANETIISPLSSAAPFARRAADQSGIILSEDTHLSEGVLLPKSYQLQGALVGDLGYISYSSPTPSAIQEQRTPVYVAGFYDPGIMPIGGKFILASRNLTGLVRASQNQQESLFGNGLNLRFKNLADTAKIKALLTKAFQKEGIESYWTIETYQEYDFTKDIIQQLQSEKNLFSLISIVIIIVACSNIISMLIILVNDKKIEIGILRSMGATAASIAAIFGLSGMVMGALGSIIGIIAAIITLNNLEFLVGMISRFQGHDLFNPVFYGDMLPNQISPEVLGSVVLATAIVSLFAGIVPAVKASLLRPSTILRSE